MNQNMTMMHREIADRRSRIISQKGSRNQKQTKRWLSNLVLVIRNLPQQSILMKMNQNMRMMHREIADRRLKIISQKGSRNLKQTKRWLSNLVLAIRNLPQQSILMKMNQNMTMMHREIADRRSRIISQKGSRNQKQTKRWLSNLVLVIRNLPQQSILMKMNQNMTMMHREIADRRSRIISQKGSRNQKQ